MKELSFSMPVGSWSDLHVEEGEIAFFYVAEKTIKPAAPILGHLQASKAILAADAKAYVAKQLIQTFKKKNSIVIPLQRDEHESI